MVRTCENIYRCKDGRWVSRLILSCKNGKKSLQICLRQNLRRKKRLEMAVAEVKKENINAEKVAEITFENFAKMWLKNKKNQVKESTFARYFLVLNKHIFPYWSGWLAGKNHNGGYEKNMFPG